VHVPSIFQLLLSGLGLVVSTLGAAGLLVFGVLSARSTASATRSQTGALLALAWTFGILALAALPSIWFSVKRLFFGQLSSGATGLRRLGFASLALLLCPLFLALGRVVAIRSDLSWLFLPPLQILVVVIPLWWLIEFARNGLAPVTPQRTWGTLNFSLFVSTPLVILVEVIGTILGILAIVIAAGTQPSLQNLMNELGSKVISANGNAENLLRIYQPYLSNPWVIFSVLIVLSAAVPLIEEFFKPLAVWMFVGRRLTPSEGFIAGAFAGAGFALVETLFSLATPAGANWTSLAIGRAGTGLLHTTNGALMGLALANVLKPGPIPVENYIRLGLTYFLTTTLHGLWNAFSILSGFGPLMPVQAGLSDWIKTIGSHSAVGLTVMVVIFLLILWFTNFNLRRAPAGSDSDLMTPERIEPYPNNQ
jgi:hypothetical protein